MKNIKVSVIVPIYNTEKFLKKCIESILNQALQEIEIILINDGSTDNSHTICFEYAKKYSEKIKYINNKNIGCSATRNLGIELAQGEYIAFVDSDDYIEKEMYEEMYIKSQKTASDIVICGFRYIYEKEKEVFIPKKEYSYLDIKNKPSYVWNKLFKKELLIKNNIIFPLESHYCEDFVFSFENLISTEKISSLENVMYNYVLHGNNSIYNFNKKLDTKISFSKVYNYLKEKNMLKNKFIMKYFFQNFYYSGIKNIFRSLLNPKIISINDTKKYLILYKNMFKEIEFISFKEKVLIFYYENLVYFIREFHLYFFLKKIKNILKKKG